MTKLFDGVERVVCPIPCMSSHLMMEGRNDRLEELKEFLFLVTLVMPWNESIVTIFSKRRDARNERTKVLVCPLLIIIRYLEDYLLLGLQICQLTTTPLF